MCADFLLEKLFEAYFCARKNKRNSREQLRFEIDLEHNVIQLRDDIMSGTYKPQPAVCFVVERPVKREVFASAFRDRVVHHLLFNFLNPYFERKMIFDSYSCRKGKGNSEGVRRLQHHILSCSDNYRKQTYVLKMDLRGYFMSIDKSLLYDIVSKHLPALCREQDIDFELVDYLLKTVIFRSPTDGCIIRGRKSDWDGLPPSKSLFNSNDGVGLPIGDLTSQLFSNIYLNELDQFVKRELKCRHYGRYVDDFYIVGNEKWELKAMIPVIRSFLNDRLKLTLHEKKIVLRDVRDGVEFVGGYVKPYRIYPTHRSVKSFHAAVALLERQNEWETYTAAKVRQTLSSINSYLGHFQNFRAYKTVSRTFGNSSLKLYYDFTPQYRKAVIRNCGICDA